MAEFATLNRPESSNKRPSGLAALAAASRDRRTIERMGLGSIVAESSGADGRRTSNRASRLSRALAFQDGALKPASMEAALEADADRATARALTAQAAPARPSRLGEPALQLQPAATSISTTVEDAASLPTTAIADDAEDLKPGQLRHADFLDALSIRTAEALGGEAPVAGDTAERARLLEPYRKKAPAELERDLRAIAPEAGPSAESLLTSAAGAIVRVAREPGASTESLAPLPPTPPPAPPPAGTGPVIHRKSMGTGDEDLDPAAVQAGLGQGRALDSGVRARLERGFGASFANVQIHTDARAAQTSAALGARAFTVGNDVGFASNEYRPGTLVGDALIAHELAHTLQQSAGAPANQEGASLEFEADTVAAQVQAGLPNVQPARRSGLALQRCGKTKAPALTSRTETTAFGTFTVWPDAYTGPLAASALTEAQLVRLKAAWTRVNTNSGGLQLSGSAGDQAVFIAIIGREMGRSKTFRDLIIEITEDTAHPVTVKVGRDNAYWVDEFGTNVLDLRDLEWFEDIPPAAYPWVQTSGEIVVHVLYERRYGAVHGTGYAPAHAATLAAGGPQETYRAERGQSGRFVSQVGSSPSPGLTVGAYTDTAGNRVFIRRDNSASPANPIVYEMEYAPSSPTPAAPGVTRHNDMVASVRASAGAPARTVYVKFKGASNTSTTGDRPLAGGGSASLSDHLGAIVPVGGPITVEVYERSVAGPDVLVVHLSWAPPFKAGTASATVSGTTYMLDVSLERR